MESADDGVSETLIQQIQHADKEKCGRTWREIARKRNLKSNAKHSTKCVKSKKQKKMLYGSTTCDFQQLDCGQRFAKPDSARGRHL